MAGLRTWTRKDGSEAHQVLFGDADTGKQTSKTFDDPAGADLLIRFLNANGPSYAAAREAARNLKSKTPTVYVIVARHIEHLTGVDSGTKHRYLQLAKNHISGKLGSTPVDKRFRVFIRMLTGSGLRFSEATALRRRDVTVPGGRAVVQVRRAWKKTDAGIQVGRPKTRKSRRTVALSPILSKTLIDHMSGLSPDDLVFTASAGGRIPNNRFHEKYWDNTVEELTGDGTLHEKPAIHDLRHSTHPSCSRLAPPCKWFKPGSVRYREPYKHLADALVAKCPDTRLIAFAQNPRKEPALNITPSIRSEPIRSGYWPRLRAGR